jgi:hydroxymethylpyrimidine/phosphomethylpyrimidine kinase
MTGAGVADVHDAVRVGQALVEKLGTAVLIKGGHLGGDESIDVLSAPGRAAEVLRGPRLPDGEHVHGTGCALSSALAAHLARGFALVDACRAAKQFVAERIASPVRPGRGAAAVV